MKNKTSQIRVLLGRCHKAVGLLVFAVFVFGGIFAAIAPPNQAQALTNTTLNFQARLQTSSGAIVPDGYYNVEFKLYSAASGGTALWTETYYDTNGVTAGNDFRIRVQNGYLTTSLGSLTAFPTTINWDQQLWITMNIGGSTQTATPTYDGEMNPRLQLTGVPYAFRAGQLATGNGSLQSTLQILQPTVGNQTFQIQDQGAAGTFNLCIQNSTACGFAAATGGAGYIQNTSSPQAGSFNVTGSATIGAGATAGYGKLTVAGAGTGSVGLTVATTAGNPAYTPYAGTVALFLSDAGNSTSFTNITVSAGTNGTASLSLGSYSSQTRGSVLYNNSTANLTLNNNGIDALNVSSTGNVGIGNINNTYKLDVSGDINSSGVYRIGGANILSTSALALTGAATVTGGTTLSLNSTAANAISLDSGTTGAVNVGTSANAKAVTVGNTTGATGVTVNAGTGNVNLNTVNTTGGTIIKSQTSNSTAALAVQNAAGASMLSVDTVHNGVIIGQVAGGTAAAAALYFGDTCTNFTQTCVKIGEYNGTDSDNLQLHGAAGLTFTTGYITQTVTGVLTNTGRLGIGIGNVAPNAALDVQGTAAAVDLLRIVDATATAQTVLTIADEGATTFKNRTNSASAFQVQSSGSATPILNVDTANSRVGIGTATPVTAFHEVVNNTQIAVPMSRLEQAGSGDASLEFKNINTSFYSGLDTSSGNSFNINSNTSAASTNTTLGQDYTSAVPNATDANPNYVQATKFTASASGSMSAMYVGFNSAQNTNSRYSVAIYSDNAGVPNAKLGQYTGTTVVNTPSPGSTNWNLLTLDSPVAITSGTVYWLAFGANDFSSWQARSSGGNSTYYSGATVGSWASTFSANGTFVSNSSYENAVYGVINTATSLTDTFNNSTFKIGQSGETTLRNSLNTTAALQVQNALGNQSLTVDTLNNQVILGKASALDGKLVFNNATNNNAVTLLSSATSANYILRLPANGPALNQCLQNDGTTVGQLTFGTCTGGASSLQSDYTASTGGTTPEIKLDATRGGLDIQDANTSIGANLLTVRATNSGGLGAALFGVGATGQTIFQNSVNSSTAFQIQNAVGAPILLVDTTTSNILVNSGFEIGTTNWAAKGTTSTFATDSTAGTPYHGQSSLKAIVSAANSGMTTSGGQAAFTTNMLANTQYQLTFYAKCSATFATLTFGRQDVAGTDVNSVTNGNCTTGWQQFTAHWTTGATITNPAIYVTLGATAAGTVFIDAVSLVQTNTSAAVPYKNGSIQLRGVVSTPATFQSGSDSTTAFQVQNAVGTSNSFVVDTLTNTTSIGGSTVASTVNIGASGTAAIGSTVNIGATTGNAAQTIVIGSGGNVSSITTLRGAVNANSATNGVRIGTADAAQTNLVLDNSSTLTETANTCTATVNAGALYYNSNAGSNAIRACINGGWEDIITTAGLGLLAFGVVPESGTTANQGDLVSIIGVGTGPCKVTIGASTNIVAWSSCLAYSGGRKISINAGTTTASNAVAGNYQHLCLNNGSSNQPALTVSSAENAGYPAFVAGAPILCIADITFAAANNTITGVADTRVFTTSAKSFVNVVTTAPTNGTLVKATTTTGQYTPYLTGDSATVPVLGVVVVSGNSSTANTVNAIIAYSGPIYVKATTSTVGSALFGSTTKSGYVAAGSGTGAYATVGIAQSTTSTTCSVSADNCRSSVFAILNPK